MCLLLCFHYHYLWWLFFCQLFFFLFFPPPRPFPPLVWVFWTPLFLLRRTPSSAYIGRKTGVNSTREGGSAAGVATVQHPFSILTWLMLQRGTKVVLTALVFFSFFFLLLSLALSFCLVWKRGKVRFAAGEEEKGGERERGWKQQQQGNQASRQSSKQAAQTKSKTKKRKRTYSWSDLTFIISFHLFGLFSSNGLRAA